MLETLLSLYNLVVMPRVWQNAVESYQGDTAKVSLLIGQILAVHLSYWSVVSCIHNIETKDSL